MEGERAWIRHGGIENQRVNLGSSCPLVNCFQEGGSDPLTLVIVEHSKID